MCFAFLTFDQVIHFLNSNFISASIGGGLSAGFGAWFGARYAQKIAFIKEHKKIIREKMTAINTSAAIAANVLNSTMSIKEQILTPIIKSYENNLNNYKTNNKREIKPDLRIIQNFTLKIDTLYDFIINSLGHRLGAITILGQLDDMYLQAKNCIDGLSSSINYLHKTQENNGNEEFLKDFFAIQETGRPTYGYYKDNLYGLRDSINALIYFSDLMLYLLNKYGKCVVDENKDCDIKLCEFITDDAKMERNYPNKNDYKEFEDLYRAK